MNKYYLVLMLSLLSVSMAESQVYHAGKITVGTPAVANGASWLIGGDLKMVQSSEIRHAATTGKTVLGGSLINNVTAGHVFSQRNGIFEFRGTKVQRIGGTADKTTNYIEFPEIVFVNNSNTANSNDSAVVILHPDMGASVKTLTLTKGRLVIDSKVSGEKTDIAHLLVEAGGGVGYVRINSPATRHNDGIIQVNLAMGSNASQGRLVGFSSPFETLYADYFFFNFLSIPTQGTFFSGNKDIWNLNPKLEMPAGRGYVLGQGIVPHTNTTYYSSHKNTAYATANFNDVAKERFSFARLFAPASLTSFVNGDAAITAEKKFIGERINTSTVNVPIQEGFNYLGNPFTAPLDLTSFVNNTNSGDWGTFTTYEMEPAFYILTPGSTGEYLGNEVFSFTASYLVGQKVGSTVDSKVLAPMQMFAVKKRTSAANTFRINASARTHGQASFLRSDDDTIENELLIETRDKETGGFDRLCVVFRKEASLKAEDLYDAEKLFNTTGGVHQIYTLSEDNMKLTTNMVPNTTPRLTMYFEPSSKMQEVTLTAGRINSLRAISDVVLEDRKTGVKTDLMTTSSYTFTSSPSDNADRFILHFTHNPTGTESMLGETTPYAYYNSNTIYVNRLRAADIGQQMKVYSMQGQLLHSQKVAETDPCRVYKPLGTGLYVVKVDGNPHVMKLIVK